MRPSNRARAACLTAIATAAPVLPVMAGDADDPRAGPPLVIVAAAEPAAPPTRTFVGIVTARTVSDLGFRVPGKVVERLVDAGQTVRAGQVLMRIDRTDLANAVTAQVAQVAAAQARVVQTAAEEARDRRLVAASDVSRSAYAEARAAADSARALLWAADAQARTAVNEGGYSELVADADGTVVETLAEPGQVVTAGQPVLRLAHEGPREAAVDLPETLRPTIGSTAAAMLYGADDAPMPARLRQLSDAADLRTRTYEARYVLAGRLAAAPLGATVSVRIAAQPASSDVAVPLGAIIDGGGGPAVWVVNAATATIALRPVSIVRLGDEVAVLAGGVRVGETVVALGGVQLHAGERIRIADDRAAMP